MIDVVSRLLGPLCEVCEVSPATSSLVFSKGDDVDQVLNVCVRCALAATDRLPREVIRPVGAGPQRVTKRGGRRGSRGFRR